MSTDYAPIGEAWDAPAQDAQGSNRGQGSAWRSRSLLDAATWSSRNQLPYCRWIAAKALA